MEFESLSENMDEEAQRVAVAFEMQECPMRSQPSEANQEFRIKGNGFELIMDFGHSESVFRGLWRLELNEGGKSYLELVRDLEPPIWEIYNHWACCGSALMARALYRLGFEDEYALAQLNHPLTAHEKLELRLSMPREFWPKTWLEKENSGVS